MMKQIFLIFLIAFKCHAASANTHLNAKHMTTKAGTPVVFYQTMDLPLLDVHIAFHAGSAFDGQRFGLSALTTSLLNQGNAQQDANQIADQLANVGAQFAAENNRDMVLVTLRTLTQAEALKQALKTYASIIQSPDFPEDAFQRQKNQQLISIQQSLESPEEVADQTFFKALYQSHPYAHPIDGEKKTVESITRDDVQQFYLQYFTKKNAHIVLVGAIDEAQALAIAEQITEKLPLGQLPSTLPKARQLSQEMDIVIPFKVSQTVLRIGQLGIDHHNPHYFALLVGNYILGGGNLVSQLAHELREKRGLTYGVYSQFVPMNALGPFVIGFSTQNQQAKNAEILTRDTLNAFIKNGPTAQELKDAKAYLTGSFPLSLASNQSIASILMKISFYQLPHDYLNRYIEHINAVTQEEIKKAFEAQLNAAQLLQVSVGPA